MGLCYGLGIGSVVMSAYYSRTCASLNSTIRIKDETISIMDRTIKALEAASG